MGASLTALLPKVDHDEVGVLRRDSWPRQQQHSLADSFTIIMQTYNRTDLLLKLLNHYQAVPHLHKVIIVWNNIGEKIPRELWDSLGPHPVPIVFKEQTVNRMRNRLQFFPELETEGTVFKLKLSVICLSKRRRCSWIPVDCKSTKQTGKWLWQISQYMCFALLLVSVPCQPISVCNGYVSTCSLFFHITETYKILVSV